MKQAYKVVSNHNGKYYSTNHFGIYSRPLPSYIYEYKLNEPTEARDGGLLVFHDFHFVKEYLFLPHGGTLLPFLCDVEEQVSLPSIRVSTFDITENIIKLLWNDEYTYNLINVKRLPWPSGTAAYKRVTLRERITF